MPPPHRRPRSVLAALLAALIVAGACSAPGGEDDGVDNEDRIAAVVELRETVGPVAAELGSAAASVAEQLEDLHTEAPVEPGDRLAAAGAIRNGSLARLEEARDAVVASDLLAGADGPDAAAVRAALEDAATAAEDLAGAAAQDLARVERLAHADARLAEVVAAWDEPGSRSEQLTRLDEAMTRAGELSRELSGVTDVPACSAAVARRNQAADALVARSRELRDLVAARRGEDFDAQRREFAASPFASTRARVEADRDEAGCWRDDAPVVRHAAAVAAALEAVEAALNPPDLAPPTEG